MNEAKFGVRTDWDESLYTTELDRNRCNISAAKAAKLAAGGAPWGYQDWAGGGDVSGEWPVQREWRVSWAVGERVSSGGSGGGSVWKVYLVALRRGL